MSSLNYDHNQSQHANIETNCETVSSGRDQRNYDCIILSNTFQIKNKSHSVLMNCRQISWQLFDGNRQHPDVNQHVCNEKVLQKSESSYEEVQQINGYKETSDCIEDHVIYLENILRTSKSVTKLFKMKQNSHTDFHGEDGIRQTNGDPKEKYLIIHYAKRIINSPTDCNRWRLRHLTLYNTDPYVIKQWHHELEKRLHSSLHRIHLKNLLIFINPYGGAKKALQIYERWCKPIIALTGIDASCVITQRQNQIRDILMSHNLQPYDAVCCVGGDGTVAEMINGLICRAMFDHNLDVKHPDYIPKPHLPIGIIPAGSTNTIAYSLHGTSDVQTAAIHLVLGIKRGFDVCSVQNSNSLLRFCASVMSYGYLGDVCAKSEKYRWMGVKRYEYTGFTTFLQNRGYAAEIHLLCDDNDNDNTHTPTKQIIENKCYANCKHCHNFQNDSQINKCDSYSDNSNRDNELRTSIKSNTREFKEFKGQFRLSGGKQKIVSQLPNGIFSRSSKAKWRTIKGNFFMISAVNMICACTRSPNGLSRYCHFGDGYMDLVLVRKTNFMNNIRLIMNTIRKNGDIRNLSFVEVYRTQQFNFVAQPSDYDDIYENNGSPPSVHRSTEPITATVSHSDIKSNRKQHSVWNCDGEAISDLNVTITSHRQLIDVLMRGPLPYKDPRIDNANTTIFCCCKGNK